MPATEGRKKVETFLVVRHELALNMLKSPLLTDAQKKVGGALLAHYNNTLRQAWPSHVTISEQTGVSMETVATSIKRLVEVGYVQIVRKGNGRGRSTVYAFPAVEKAAELDADPE